MRSHRSLARAAAALGSSVLFAGLMGGVALAHGPGHPGNGHGHNHGHKGALYVSPNGKPGAADRNCGSAGYSTVQSAVDAAANGSTVVVCPGTYMEDVVVSKSLTLTGKPGAVIKGTSSTTLMCTQVGPKGPFQVPCLAGITLEMGHSTVQGLTVTGATGEGILAAGSLAGGSISDVLIEHNRVVGNNIGGLPNGNPEGYVECEPSGQVPGDCGEAIHLMGVTHSTVSHNLVEGNVGGVLLTDELGPTAHNVISHNVITGNAYDCGVTAPGHNPFALDSSGKPQPAKAGVYGNLIEHNQITFNGLKGEGAGVLFANATAGTASYDNMVAYNYIAGNELSGVTMHAHTIGPGQFEDLSGNQIVHNTIGKNNTGGDPLDSPATATDPSTTGILVFSASVPVNAEIAHNRISHDTYGIWLGVGGHATASMTHNAFQHVTTHVFTSP
jgi:Periplasmic copper-binding protein (NosD)